MSVSSQEKDRAKTPDDSQQESALVETLRVIVHAVIIAVVIRTFVLQPFYIPSESMESTLLVGDYLFVSKFSYGFSHFSLPWSPHLFSGRILASQPQRGDVVVFRLPRDDDVDYIKRVIGLPGDSIQMKDGVLNINGVPVKREQLPDYKDEDTGGAGMQRRLDFDPLSRTAVLDYGVPTAVPAKVGIVCAGTSDMSIAVEAQRGLAFHGVSAMVIGDVGVAGLWRLFDRLDEIASWRVAIVVAGMEGALFSVVAGQVSGLVIAVPTSVGYGVAAGGTAALHCALASCSPGVVVVNIDNGFGAACAALKLLRVFASA